MAPLSQADRTFLDDNFRRYGEAWANGLAGLEKDFDVQGTAKWRRYELSLTMRTPPHLTFQLQVRKNGAMSHSGPKIPMGPELSAEQLKRVDEILKRENELWLIEPMNNYLVVTGVSKGLESIRTCPPDNSGEVEMYSRDRETLDGLSLAASRSFGTTAVLYFRAPHRSLVCFELDLSQSSVQAVKWVDFPDLRAARLLSSAEREHIDRAFRKNGDFGVYGSVTSGLDWVKEEFEVKIGEDEEEYQLTLDPRDGYGHFFHFSLNKVTGTIGAVMSGHRSRGLHPRED